jgi:LysM repeat protein
VVKKNVDTVSVNQKNVQNVVKDNQETMNPSKFHIVQRGETLFSIARKFNITVLDLMKINNLSNADIHVNDTIYLEKINTSVNKGQVKETVKTEKNNENQQAGQNINTNPYDTVYHEVKSGEDLYTISKLYSVNVIDLININKIDVIELKNGQKLIVKIIDKATGKNILSRETVQPKEKQNETKVQDQDNKPDKDKVKTEAIYHVVQSGETLYHISVVYKTTVDEIRKLNGLKDNTISVGQKLLIHPAR